MSLFRREHSFEAGGLLILLLFVSTTLMLTSHTLPGKILRESAATLFSHILAPVMFIPESFTLWEENRTLAHQNIQLVLETARLKHDMETLAQTDILMKSVESGSLKVTPARVISREDGNLVHRLHLEVDDSESSIHIDDPVIAPDGLAGKVVQVSRGNCVAILLNDPDFRVRVKLDRSGVEGIMYFDLGSGGYRIKNIPLTTTPVLGEQLFTSGLASIFPPDIPVAHLVSFQTTSGLFWDMTVEPDVELTALYTVGVLTTATSREGTE